MIFLYLLCKFIIKYLFFLQVISAKADVESAKLMREAADILDSRTAMQIRYLETITMIGKGANSKIIFLPEMDDATKIQHKIT